MLEKVIQDFDVIEILGRVGDSVKGSQLSHRRSQKRITQQTNTQGNEVYNHNNKEDGEDGLSVAKTWHRRVASRPHSRYQSWCQKPGVTDHQELSLQVSPPHLM